MKNLFAAFVAAARWMIEKRAPIVYNVSVAAGVALVGVGVGLHDQGAGLATAGLLILALSVYMVRIQTRGRD